MKKEMVRGEECAINAEGAFVPVARIKRIDIERDALVYDLCNRATDMSAMLQGYKVEAFALIERFIEKSAREHKVKVRGRNGGFSLMSYDGLFKIVVDNDEKIVVNEKVSIAREAIFACVKKWSEGSNANLVEIVRRAFETDKQGHLSIGRLLALRSYKIDDSEWKAAMDALAQGLTVCGSKTYIRFYVRASVDEKYVQIPLG